MKSSVIGAAITAAAATLLVCTTVFASGVAVDLAVTGLFHLPALATTVIGAMILGADGWLGVRLFREAYAFERRIGHDGEIPGS